MGTEAENRQAFRIQEHWCAKMGAPIYARICAALAGGLLAASPAYREHFLAALADRGLTADPAKVVTEPAEGAVRLALALVKA